MSQDCDFGAKVGSQDTSAPLCQGEEGLSNWACILWFKRASKYLFDEIQVIFSVDYLK